MTSTISRYDFEARVARARRVHSRWFTDKLVVRQPDAALPIEYDYFLQTYGSGYFAHLLVIPPIFVEGLHGGQFLACADDQSGGYYVFDPSQASGAVSYWYPAESDPPRLVSAGFFDLVIDVALEGLVADS